MAQALLGAWEADRVLAHLCLVASVAGNGETLALRRAASPQIVALLAGAPVQPLAAEPVLAGALGSVWELAFRELTEDTNNSDRRARRNGDLPDACAVRRPPPGRGTCRRAAVARPPT